jgi:hypothetical protein
MRAFVFVATTIALCSSIAPSAWAQPPSTRVNFEFGEASQSLFSGASFGVAFAPSYSGSVDLLQWGFPGVRLIGPHNALVSLAPGDTFAKDFVLDRPVTFRVDGGGTYDYIYHQKLQVESHEDSTLGQVNFISMVPQTDTFDLGDSGILEMQPFQMSNIGGANAASVTPLMDFSLRQPNAIPEPATSALVVLGLLSLGKFVVRRKRFV